MRLGAYRISAEIGHLVLLLAIAGWTAWYLLDAIAASASIQNLMMIAPASAVVLALCLWNAARAVRVTRDETGLGLVVALRAEGRTILFIALLAAYVAGLAHVAFDLSTLIFVAAGLILLGERRWWLAIGYAAVFAQLVTMALKAMVSFPFPTLWV